MNEQEKSKGKRAAELVVRFFSHISSLLLANVLFVVCSLPVITAGPSLIALSRVCCLAVRDETTDTAREFFRVWKREFKTGLLLNLTLIPALVLLTLSALRGVRVLLLESWSLSAVVAFVLYFLLMAFAMYLLPLLAFMDAPLPTIAGNALRLCFANGMKTVAGSLLSGGILLAGLACYPYSFPLILLILFGATVYVGACFGWNAAERHIFRPYYASHPDEPNAERFTED